MNNDYITLKEAAKESGKSLRTIQRLARKLKDSEPFMLSTRVNKNGNTEQLIAKEVLSTYYPSSVGEGVVKPSPSTKERNESILNPGIRRKLSQAYREQLYLRDLLHEKTDELKLAFNRIENLEAAQYQIEELKRKNKNKNLYLFLSLITIISLSYLAWRRRR